MKITLYRKWLKPGYTAGKLSVNGERLCETLEPPIRDFEEMTHQKGIHGQGCALECGEYKVSTSFNEKENRTMPFILKTRTFILAIERCKDCHIGVGRHYSPGRLENGRYYETVLKNMILEAERDNKKITLTIKQ